MPFLPETQTTAIATSTVEDVIVRDKRLCADLIGKLTFTEMLFFQILGRTPSRAEAAVVDACLVSLMEHGLTPNALATRLTYTSAPEAMQGAVAAGLLGVGSLFVGTMDGCGRLLQRLVEAEAGTQAEEARRIAREHRAARTPLPGFGHPIHRPDDPRARLLIEIAKTHEVAARHVEALGVLSAAVDEVYERHITINVTGAIAAALADCGVPYEIMRGFAIITRCAGLVGHVHEEQRKPAMRVIWETSEAAVPYEGAAASTE